MQSMQHKKELQHPCISLDVLIPELCVIDSYIVLKDLLIIHSFITLHSLALVVLSYGCHVVIVEYGYLDLERCLLQQSPKA
jgi:hypothetical protein